jgi:hypothetical protein
MVHLISAIFFSVSFMISLAMIAAMLRAEWRRIVAILTGQEMQAARAKAPAARVRVRAWRRAETRGFEPVRHAAAA